MKNSLNAQLIGASIPMSESKPTLDFYSHLVGMKAGRSLSDTYETYHVWGSAGVKLIFAVPDTKNKDWTPAIMLNFRVDDISKALEVVEANGGRKMYGPFPLTVAESTFKSFAKSYETLAFGDESEVTKEMGQCLVVLDPSGNRIILTELESYAERFFENGQVSRHEIVEHAFGLKNAKSLA